MIKIAFVFHKKQSMDLVIKIPGPMLVLAEFHYVVGQISELQVGESIVSEVLQ